LQETLTSRVHDQEEIVVDHSHYPKVGVPPIGRALRHKRHSQNGSLTTAQIGCWLDPLKRRMEKDVDLVGCYASYDENGEKPYAGLEHHGMR
jgi:hypothetical protein